MIAHPLHDPVSNLMRQVGETVLLRHFRKLSDEQIEEKSPGDPVTIADRESEKRLAAGLAGLLPAASIVGEEAVAADPAVMDRLGDGLCWIIDPIDGTANYAEGRSPFGILIALAEAGETVAGWIFDPMTKRLCHAHLGHGASIDGETILARPSGETPPIAAISTLFLDDERRRDVIAKLEGRYRTVDIPRCAAEQYPRLALGTNDVSLFERTLAWDHAAGALFLNEAGGKAARPDGSTYRVDDRRTGLIGAASPRLWDEAAAIFG